MGQAEYTKNMIVGGRQGSVCRIMRCFVLMCAEGIPGAFFIVSSYFFSMVFCFFLGYAVARGQSRSRLELASKEGFLFSFVFLCFTSYGYVCMKGRHWRECM